MSEKINIGTFIAHEGRYEILLLFTPSWWVEVLFYIHEDEYWTWSQGVPVQNGKIIRPSPLFSSELEDYIDSLLDRLWKIRLFL